MKEELLGRVFELEVAGDVKKLFHPQGENDEGRFDPLLYSVRERIGKTDLNPTWCMTYIKQTELETNSYTSWVYILNTVAQALDDTIKEDQFREFGDHSDLLKFFSYDREVEFGVDGANPLKPNILALDENLWKKSKTRPPLSMSGGTKALSSRKSRAHGLICFSKPRHTLAASSMPAIPHLCR